MSGINLSRSEWESYVKAKMLQAKLDRSATSIFVRENFGGDFGYSAEDVFGITESKGWLEYVGEVEHLNATIDAWLTDMGVLFEHGHGPRNHVSCNPESHLERMREMDRLSEDTSGDDE